MAHVAREQSVNELEMLDDEELDIVRRVAHKYFGFELPENKRTMLSRRLAQFARDKGALSAGSLVRTELVNPSKEVLVRLAVFLTTNHTFFHRESQHFDRLESVVLPELIQRLQSSRDIRIWCAASSSGQEPYELGMCLEDCLGTSVAQWKRGILATDISEKVLREAKAGIYTEEQVSTLPPARLRKYLRPLPDSTYSISPSLREIMSFGRFNLLTKKLPFQRKFHVVFCRNVMIYFSPDVRQDVLGRLADSLIDGGYLFIGRSESARGMESKLRFIEPGAYQKVNR